MISYNGLILLCFISFSYTTLYSADAGKNIVDQNRNWVIDSLSDQIARLLSIGTSYFSNSYFIPAMTITKWHVALAAVMTSGAGYYAVHRWILSRIWVNTEKIKEITEKIKEIVENLIKDLKEGLSEAKEERKKIEGKLDQQEKTVSQVKIATDDIKKTVGTIEGQVTGHKELLGGLCSTSNRVQGQVTTVLENIAKNKSEVELKMQGLEKTLDDNFANLNKKYDNFQGKLDNLEPNLKKIIGENIKMYATESKNQFKSINDLLKNIHDKEDLLTSQLNSLKEDSKKGHDELFTKLTSFEAQVSKVSTDVSDLKDYMNKIKDTMGTLAEYAKQQAAFQEIIYQQMQTPLLKNNNPTVYEEKIPRNMEQRYLPDVSSQ